MSAKLMQRKRHATPGTSPRDWGKPGVICVGLTAAHVAIQYLYVELELLVIPRQKFFKKLCLSHVGKKESVNAKSVKAFSEGSILIINKLHSFTAEQLIVFTVLQQNNGIVLNHQRRFPGCLHFLFYSVECCWYLFLCKCKGSPSFDFSFVVDKVQWNVLIWKHDVTTSQNLRFVIVVNKKNSNRMKKKLTLRNRF